MFIWLVWFKNSLAVVTTDGRYVGDVVQYVPELIIDGDDTNDELANDLALMQLIYQVEFIFINLKQDILLKLRRWS